MTPLAKTWIYLAAGFLVGVIITVIVFALMSAPGSFQSGFS